MLPLIKQENLAVYYQLLDSWRAMRRVVPWVDRIEATSRIGFLDFFLDKAGDNLTMHEKNNLWMIYSEYLEVAYPDPDDSEELPADYTIGGFT